MLLEVRVTPFLERDLTSFVHEYLVEIDRLGEYQDNGPRAIRCVYPLVTLIEKLDALQNRVRRDDREPATFVRHFEDAAHIIASALELPALAGYSGVVCTCRRDGRRAADPATASVERPRLHTRQR